MRRTEAEITAESKQALDVALEELGVPHRLIADGSFLPDSHRSRADYKMEIAGALVVVEVKSVVDSIAAKELVDKACLYRLPVIVASDRIAESARAVLRDAGVGYFDRRGHLRLVLPGVFVDTTVPGRTLRPPARSPLSGEAAKEVALLLLEDPHGRPGVRAIARRLERAPSSVSVALEGLQTVGLVTSANEPLVPDLFWELEGVWRREQVALAAVPQPGSPRMTDPLQLGLGQSDDVGWKLDPIGWALTDTLAAMAYGAPVVSAADYPPDFYVPSQAVVSRAVSTLGGAQRADERACTVSIAPVRLVCRRRISLQNETWPVAGHVVVALDLAKDRARGRDVLERWHPKDLARVW